MPIFSSKVKVDSITKGVSQPFEYKFDGSRTFTGWEKPEVPSNFRLGLIVGPSGSGKSLLLKEFGKETDPRWTKGESVASHFRDVDDATNRLTGVGLNSIPTWCSDFQVLSTGEQFRANLARKIGDHAVIDEFTSVVDRNVAKAASCALRRYVDKHDVKGMVLASCHEDIIPWLQPDWYFTTTDGILHDGRLLRRPSITIRIYPCSRNLWGMFAPHHYLSHVLASSAKCYVVTAEFEKQTNVVGFVSCRPYPTGSIRRAWLEHRTVILPDFQGLGIGPRASDAVASLYLSEGKHYFSRTAHPRFGAYRNKPNSGWMPTTQYKGESKYARNQASDKGTHTGAERINTFGGDNRLAFSHEYVGKI